MEPKRKLDSELQTAKFARISDYFNDPKQVPVNKLLTHIQCALEQIQAAPASADHLYKKAMTAVVAWAEISRKNRCRETIQKVYSLCRKIILQTSKLHLNEEALASINLDVARIPLTRTQIDLFRFESGWADHHFNELANKADTTVTIPFFNITQYEVIAKYILDETPVIQPVEMLFYLRAATLLEAPSFAVLVAEQFKECIRNSSFGFVMRLYDGLPLIISLFQKSLINDCLLRFSFLPINLITQSEQGYLLNIDSEEFVVTKRNINGEIDPLYALISFRLAKNKPNNLARANELFNELPEEYQKRSVGNLFSFRLLALAESSHNIPLKKLNQAIMQERGDCPALFKEGRGFLNQHAKVFFQNENYNNALILAQQVLDLDPNCPEALYRIAKIYDLIGKTTDEVISKLEHALLADKEFHKARLYLAKMFKKQEKHQKAIAECSHLIRSNYKTAKIYEFRGTLYYNRGRFAEAIHDFKKQSALNPKASEPHKYLAEIYIEQKNYPEALKCILRAEKILNGSTEETRLLKLQIPRTSHESPGVKEAIDNASL